MAAVNPSGAGAGAQTLMGTGLVWGMLIATGLGLFIIQFAFVDGLGGRWRAAAPLVGDRAQAAPAAGGSY